MKQKAINQEDERLRNIEKEAQSIANDLQFAGSRRWATNRNVYDRITELVPGKEIKAHDGSVLYYNCQSGAKLHLIPNQ